MKYLISTAIISLLLFSCEPDQNPLPPAVTYEFEIEIVDGSLYGQKYRGKFNYDISQVNWTRASDTVLVNELEFTFKGKSYTEMDFNYEPYLVFRRGELLSLHFLKGEADDAFGLNDYIYPIFHPNQMFTYSQSNQNLFSEGFGQVHYFAKK